MNSDAESEEPFQTEGLPAVSELVPHQTPVLALERLTHWRIGAARGTMTVRPSNPFVYEGKLHTAMSLEYMAQCVAACLGMEAYREGGNVRVGMVVACRKMQIHKSAMRLGESYLVQADCVRGTDAISHYDGEIRESNGELVANCTMTLVHGEKPPE